MNFGELKSLARAYVPQSKANAISVATMGQIINAGVADVALRGKCIRTYEDFDSLSGVSKYNLSANLTRFMALDEGGVWFDDGDGFKDLDPFTVSKMKNDFPNFQTDEDSAPLRYYVLGDDLYLHPGVETGASDKIRVHFIQRPMPMTDDAQYPFHAEGSQTTEVERLEILSESVLLYVESRFLKILNEKQESILKNQEYLADVAAKIQMINGRPDVAADKKSKFQGPRIPRC